jgi:hypothetical protein
MREERRTGEPVQHLGVLRLHARAFAGRKNDGESRAIRHVMLSLPIGFAGTKQEACLVTPKRWVTLRAANPVS